MQIGVSGCPVRVDTGGAQHLSAGDLAGSPATIRPASGKTTTAEIVEPAAGPAESRPIGGGAKIHRSVALFVLSEMQEGFGCDRPEDTILHSPPPGLRSDQDRLIAVATPVRPQYIGHSTLIGAEHRSDVLKFQSLLAQKTGGFSFPLAELARSNDADLVQKHPRHGVTKSSHGFTSTMAAVVPSLLGVRRLHSGERSRKRIAPLTTTPSRAFIFFHRILARCVVLDTTSGVDRLAGSRATNADGWMQ